MLGIENIEYVGLRLPPTVSGPPSCDMGELRLITVLVKISIARMVEYDPEHEMFKAAVDFITSTTLARALDALVEDVYPEVAIKAILKQVNDQRQKMGKNVVSVF